MPDENYRRALAIIKDAQAGSKRGLEFTEIMSGFMYMGDDIEDFEIAADAAKASAMSARFFLSVHAWDIDNREFTASDDLFIFRNLQS